MTKADVRQLDRAITDSAAALQEIDQLQDRVAALTAALDHRERLATLGTIAGLIAHEFNNILTPVMSYAQMALAKPDDRELTAKALGKAVEGTERASAIAAAILGFVRDDTAGVPRGTPCTVRVSTALEGALECLAREPAKDGIRLEVGVPDDLVVRMKPVALQHVLLNLILNARAAMLPGGGVLAIRAWRVEQAPPRPVTAVGGTVTSCGSPWVVIEVGDTGRGMSPVELTRLFEPFYSNRAVADEPGPRERRRGTGLGMTICERLVEESGGAVWVESAPGRGTRVSVVVSVGITNNKM